MFIVPAAAGIAQDAGYYPGLPDAEAQQAPQTAVPKVSRVPVVNLDVNVYDDAAVYGEEKVPEVPPPRVKLFYRLQVGSFYNANLAQDCFGRLRSLGFCPAYEQYGNMWRVIIPGVEAAQVSQFIHRLETANFISVWIRLEL
jgi:cell division protein FtsN